MSEPLILYEDKNFLAVNKPAGLLVHSIRNKLGEHTLVDWVLTRWPEVRNVGDEPELRPGIVHRLDRDTSGVILVAKTQAAFTYLKSLFASRSIHKVYLAWVWGVPRERRGKIVKPIGIVSGSTKRSVRSSKMSKEAVTDYAIMREVEKEGIHFALLQLIPHTGRTHQLRVHCASMGHPIVGDSLYGRKNDQFPGLLLHAFSIELPLMKGNTIVHIEADPPQMFLNFDVVY